MNGVHENVTEGTQTTEEEDMRDDGVQTDETLLSDDVEEKLKISEKGKDIDASPVPVAVQTAAV